MNEETIKASGEAGSAGQNAGSGFGIDWLDNVMGTLGLKTQDVTSIGLDAMKLLALVFVGLIVAKLVRNMVTRVAIKAKLDPIIAKFFGNIARYAVLAFLLVAVLGIFGIETTSLAAAFAAAGFAVAMALQGSLGNFAAGIMLLVFRPFKIGDVINAAGVTGKVAELDLFTTELTTPDNRKLIVPNGSIFGSTIENITHHPIRRVGVNVGTDYGADVNETRAILEKVVASVQDGMQDPAPQVFLSALGASSIDWQLRVWTETGKYWDVHQALINDCKKALDDANVGIPFPQIDVHMDPQFVDAMRR